jgi:uncharacterized protein (TIGR03435 family)
MLARVCILAISVVTYGSAQSTSFEVASLRSNRSGDVNMGAAAQPGGRFIARNVPLRFLIGAAYDIKDFQILWSNASGIDTDRFDIVANAPKGTLNGFEPLKPMLRSLLISRFKLATHNETRDLPAYELAPAKSGLKLLPAKDATCTAPDPKNPRPRELTPFCDNIRTGKGLVEGYGILMPRLVACLSDILGRPVIDRTGSQAIFDLHLEFAPEEVIADGIPTRGGQPTHNNDPEKPSIFTALQEQYGLRLEKGKGPVQVLVIDHVERPSEN